MISINKAIERNDDQQYQEILLSPRHIEDPKSKAKDPEMIHNKPPVRAIVLNQEGIAKELDRALDSMNQDAGSYPDDFDGKTIKIKDMHGRSFKITFDIKLHITKGPTKEKLDAEKWVVTWCNTVIGYSKLSNNMKSRHCTAIRNTTVDGIIIHNSWGKYS